MIRAASTFALSFTFTLTFTFFGCASQAPRVEVARAVGRNAKARLGWLTRDDPDTLVTCNRRVDDQGNGVGILGPCAKVGTDGVSHTIVSWTNAEHPDTSAADAGPWHGCWLELDDAQLVPRETPARAWFVTPGEKRLLEEWHPEPTLTADQYRLEASISPEHKWLALAHLAIGLGEGERIVEIPAARLLPLPDCPAAGR